MSTYDSLLLSYGGGIISDKKKSKQYTGAAALVIGIGGTGMAALTSLKAKVYQQLEPDNPGEPIPKYKHIQFLGIDSDETDLKGQRGAGKLTKDEFFPIGEPNLRAILEGKKTILDDPQMNWMDIDKIDRLLSPQGAGGVRQVGRYLLLSKAGDLYTRIQQKCVDALEDAPPHIDVYIFAGISGGTGSGCFLDTCYIVQKALADRGWDSAGNIMGFFFLPDVVTSKKEVAANPASLAYNRSNGYAAMKELDYLMSLQDADDWFEQNYGTFVVRTQKAPVDMCHLISATRADGSVVNNAFGYGINVASDYVMAYLADVDLNGKKAGEEDGGMTMQGHLSNVTTGVAKVPREHGANLSYHVLGAANAEIPYTQIATYLAAGLFGKFRKAVGRGRIAVTDEDVRTFCRENYLTFDGVYGEVTKETEQMMIPVCEKKELKEYGPMPLGKTPNCWGTEGLAWVARSKGNREKNAGALTRELETFEYDKVPEDSLIGKVFRELYNICLDPNRGPYYAAALLDHAGFDMMAAISGEAVTAREQKKQATWQQSANAQWIVDASADFINKPSSNKRFNNYYEATKQYFWVTNMIGELEDTAKVLENLRTQLSELYKNYFAPLCELLDRLGETFDENLSYLKLPEASQPTAYTWQILKLADVQKMLDKDIEDLTENQYVVRFVRHLVEGYDAWNTRDEGRITQHIRSYMEQAFGAVMNRSLQDYLSELFKEKEPNKLADKIHDEILEKVHRMALPMFWCDPTFKLDAQHCFPNSSVSVPAVASAVCNAAEGMKKDHPEYAVRKTGIQDRIFALRLSSGIPFYAYQGVIQLKGDYDAAANDSTGAGSHLYAFTDRGVPEDNSGRKDWRNFLPTPMPYSKNAAMVPEGEELLKLYEEGEAHGVIGVNAQKEYVLYKSQPVEIPAYTQEDFLENGELVKARLDEALEGVRKIRSELYRQGCQTVGLKNDGNSKKGVDIVDRVRKDYFLHYPQLQADVRAELEKVKALDDAIAALERIEAESRSYETELKQFCDILFYRIATCDTVGEEDYSKITVISHAYRKPGAMDEDTLNLSKKLDGMPYAEEFPLYQAFLTYRSLNANTAPRREMDKTAKELDAGKKREYDNVVGFKLEQVWTKEAMDDLVENKMRSLSKQEIKDILRFYNGLRRCIQRFKNQFTAEDWRRIPGQEQTGQKNQPVPQNPPVLKEIWTLWGNGRYLYIYRQYGLNQAWDDTAKTWVPLTPDMWVYDDQGQPHPITLDANGWFRP